MNKYLKVFLWYVAAVVGIGTINMMESHSGGFISLPEEIIYIVLTVYFLPYLLFAYFHLWFQGKDRGSIVRAVYFGLFSLLYLWTIYVVAAISEDTQFIQTVLSFLHVINLYIAPIVLAGVIFIGARSTDQMRKNMLIRYTGYWILVWPMISLALLGSYGLAGNPATLFEEGVLVLIGAILIHNSSPDVNIFGLRNKYNFGLLALLLLLTSITLVKTLIMYFERGFVL